MNGKKIVIILTIVTLILIGICVVSILGFLNYLSERNTVAPVEQSFLEYQQLEEQYYKM